MSWIFPLLTLLATLFGFYLQRKDYEKSQKPAPQIVLGDKDRRLFVQLQNNGVGPLLVEQLSFLKDDVEYSGIEECLSFDPKSYNHDTEISPDTPKIVHPGRDLEIFGMVFEPHEGEEDISRVRNELACLQLKVIGKDTYDNKIITKRDFQWFTRHTKGIAS